MDYFDAWHHWLWLRPLLAFILGAPLLIVAVFVDRQLRRVAERKARESASAVSGSAHIEQTATGASVTPVPWSWTSERGGTRGRIAVGTGRR